MMEKSPLVSVGLPIYNRPEGLRRTLECIVNQTYKNIERITYFRHSENMGWGYNTNFVIGKAKGDYFFRATDDDWWDITYIEKIMKLMLEDESVILGMSNFIEVDVMENKSKIHIENHLPLLQQFTTKSQYNNVKNYIRQFEGFGKAMLYGGIIKVKYIRSSLVYELIKDK